MPVVLDIEFLIVVAAAGRRGLPAGEVPAELAGRITRPLYAIVVAVEGGRVRLTDAGRRQVEVARGLREPAAIFTRRCPRLPRTPEADALDAAVVANPDDAEALAAFARYLRDHVPGHVVAGLVAAGRELAENAGYHGVSLRELLESRND